jgi:hypothetical protein
MSSGWGLSWMFMLRRWIGIERVERPDSHVVSDREVVPGCFHSFKTHGAGFSALPYRQTRKRSAARDLRRHRGTAGELLGPNRSSKRLILYLMRRAHAALQPHNTRRTRVRDHVHRGCLPASAIAEQLALLQRIDRENNRDTEYLQHLRDEFGGERQSTG